MTQNHFDQAASEWDKKKRRQELAKSIAENIARLPLNDTMTAMEYGCGTGLVGLALAPRIGMLTAVDTSAGMLEVLNEKIKEIGLANVTSKRLDLTEEAFEDRFDLIFSAMTLHHIENTELILSKLCRLLNKNGYLAIADLDKEDGSFHSAGAGEKHHGFDRNALAEIIRKNGLSSLHFKTVHTVNRTGDDGTARSYPVFLMTAQK